MSESIMVRLHGLAVAPFGAEAAADVAESLHQLEIDLGVAIASSESKQERDAVHFLLEDISAVYRGCVKAAATGCDVKVQQDHGGLDYEDLGYAVRALASTGSCIEETTLEWLGRTIIEMGEEVAEKVRHVDAAFRWAEEELGLQPKGGPPDPEPA